MSSPKPKVAILDAYRRSNAGDGLLVDESAELIREALGDVETTLVSMQPSGFPEYQNGIHPLAGRGENAPTRASLARAALLGRPHDDVTRAIADADLAVSVGGGYLRADSIVAGLKAYLSHVVQAPTRQPRTPHIYLPQSIGPLPPKFIPFGLSRLRKAQHIFVRDDRSLDELHRRGVAAERLPDLAILAMAREGISPNATSIGGAPVALVGRALAGPDRGYRARMDTLRRELSAQLLVQSRGAGNDDPSFYRDMGWGEKHEDLLPELKAAPPATVVSVRLHGSLQSLLAGVPSVHLSYERKGWGAYEDLGIAEYVHNAWTFDVDQVIDQTRQLVIDPSSYWDRVRTALRSHRDSRQRIVDVISESIGL